MATAVDGYIHLFWANAATEYRTTLDQLKRSQYVQYVKKNLQSQINSFKRTRAKKTFSGEDKDIKEFLKQTEYGKTIANVWNKSIENYMHGFTSTILAYENKEDKDAVSFSLGMNTSAEKMEEILQKIVDKGKNPLKKGAETLEDLSNSIDNLTKDLGAYLIDSLTKENADPVIIQHVIQQVGNNNLIQVPTSVSFQSQTAIKDWNHIILKNQELKDYARELFNYSSNSNAYLGTKIVGKAWGGIARFLNSFGGFIGEVSAYVGLYQAINDPKAKEELKQIKDIWHTGSYGNVDDFVQTSVVLKNDPEFEKFLMEKASFADNFSLKDDIELIINNNLVKGSVGVNIKEGGMLDLENNISRANHYLTLDTSYTFAQLIQNAISQNRTFPREFGDKYFYYNLSAAIPYGRSFEDGKDKAKRGVNNQLTNMWNNYKETIVNANILSALMGRLNDAQVSAGNNSLLLLVNGKVYTVLEVMQALVNAIGNGKNAKTGHFLRMGNTNFFNKKKAEQINLENFQGEELNKDDGRLRSSIVEPLLEQVFNDKKIDIRMNLSLLKTIV